jgi:hypothetical protein
VHRWLGYAPDVCTPEAIIAEANARRDKVMIVDLFGKVMLETPGAHSSHRPVKSGVIFGNHVYPITQGKYPILIQEPVNVIESTNGFVASINWMNEKLVSEHAMMYRVNGSYHIDNTGTIDGKWMRTEPAAEPWMVELIDAMPRCDGWAQDVLRIFKEGTLDLLYNRFAYGQIVAWDMERAYHRVFTSLCGNFLGLNLPLFNPCIFDEFERILPARSNINNECWYLMKSTGSCLEKLGLSSSLVPGCTMLLLFDRNIATPTHRIRFAPEHRAARLYDKLKDLGVDRQRLFARVCIGMFGRVRVTNSIDVRLENHNGDDDAFDPWQMAWYRSQGFSINGGLMSKTTDAIDIKNRLPLWCATVHGTNYMVLRKLFQVLDSTGLMPVSIRVDGLYYETDLMLTAIGDIMTAEEEDQIPKFVKWRNVEPNPIVVQSSRGS